MQLDFHAADYQVTGEGLVIKLLPKEYALLEFLYRRKGRPFTREQLLDQVWPMEYPVERTVDDHIYRLRKKLAPLAAVEIRTVRGLGYSLVMPGGAGSPDTTPTIRDPELNKAMQEVFIKYHQYGQGRSMLTLARQQDVLGYELSPFYSIYLHFVQADLKWLLNTEQFPLRERYYFLLLFYMFTHDPKQGLDLCRRVLENRQLPREQHMELEILNIVDLHMLTGRTDIAMERLRLTRRLIAGDPELASFLPHTVITSMLAQLAAGAKDGELEKIAVDIEAKILTNQPFLREKGAYLVAKGLWRLRQQQWPEMERLLDEGLVLLEKTAFVPMKLHALYRIIHFFDIFAPREKERRKYVNLYEQTINELGLRELLPALENVLES